MIPIPSGAQVWLATGHTDMRRGFDGLALMVQETLKRDPHSGHLFVFRRTASSRSRRLNSAICWKASIGGCRNGRGVPKPLDERATKVADLRACTDGVTWAWAVFSSKVSA
jgi:transposase